MQSCSQFLIWIALALTEIYFSYKSCQNPLYCNSRTILKKTALWFTARHCVKRSGSSISVLRGRKSSWRTEDPELCKTRGHGVSNGAFLHAPSAFTNASGTTLDVLIKDIIRMYAFSQEGIYWFLGGYELRFNLNNTCLPLSNTSPRFALKTWKTGPTITSLPQLRRINRKHDLFSVFVHSYHIRGASHQQNKWSSYVSLEFFFCNAL